MGGIDEGAIVHQGDQAFIGGAAPVDLFQVAIGSHQHLIGIRQERADLAAFRRIFARVCVRKFIGNQAAARRVDKVSLAGYEDVNDAERLSVDPVMGYGLRSASPKRVPTGPQDPFGGCDSAVSGPHQRPIVGLVRQNEGTIALKWPGDGAGEG